MLKHRHISNHERVVFAKEKASRLKAIIALHSTARGPAAGGVRIRRYARTEHALDDVLRLSQAMTFKNAMADLPLGGGKSVIIADSEVDKSDALLEAFGRVVERLDGSYWAAEDMGVGPTDMQIIARSTRFVAGLPTGLHASGDPSPITARGVFEGIKRALAHATGSEALAGRRVAVQGVGHVGASLCGLLHEAGAKLVITDANMEAVMRAASAFGADGVDLDRIYDAEVDVFAPCAIGGILNDATIPRLRARIVAGAANNQLAEIPCGDRLTERGILYVPDYVINSGGIINVAAEILKVEEPRAWVETKLRALVATLDDVLTTALRERRSPHLVADEIAASRIPSNSPRHRPLTDRAVTT